MSSCVQINICSEMQRMQRNTEKCREIQWNVVRFGCARLPLPLAPIERIHSIREATKTWCCHCDIVTAVLGLWERDWCDPLCMCNLKPAPAITPELRKPTPHSSLSKLIPSSPPPLCFSPPPKRCEVPILPILWRKIIYTLGHCTCSV